METYSETQLEAVLAAAPEGWPRLAILMLLGTGMRVGELCSLTLEIERLRRILGHTTYAMVMRYVHLDKGDLYRDFDQRSPF